MRGYILIDGNSLAHAANATKVLKVGTQETQAIYGVIRTIRAMIHTYSMLAPLVLWDGDSWRKTFFKEYKASREAEDTVEKPLSKTQIEQQARRASLNTQKPFLFKGLKMLGITQMRAQNLEADDLAAILVRRYKPLGKKIMMVTGDKDWIQLIGPSVGWIDHRTGERVTLKNIDAICGVDTPKKWLEVKAIMGDVSDEIGGVGGIGDKGAIELIRTYGSVASFVNRYNEGELEKLPKKFADFAGSTEKQATFMRNMRLMDLNSKDIPAPVDLRITKAEPNKEHYKEFCRVLCFQSMLTDYDGFFEPFERKA